MQAEVEVSMFNAFTKANLDLFGKRLGLINGYGKPSKPETHLRYIRKLKEFLT